MAGMFGTTDVAFKYARVAASAVNLAGKRVVVTGGTDGIGAAIARAAAAHGAAVTIVGRTQRGEPVPGIAFLRADLSLMTEADRIGRTLPADTDYVVMTHGIISGGKTRAVSKEGIELDMAVSALSRVVMMAALAPRLPPTSRVFVMGMPGGGEKGVLGDLNSEVTYTHFGQTHMNTVAANEALVRHYGATGAQVFGLNPGFIATGIRNPLHGGGFWGTVMEKLVGWFSITADVYANDTVLPLLVAPELATRPGGLFSQRGVPILPTPAFADPAYVARWMEELRALAARAMAAGAAGGAGGAGGGAGAATAAAAAAVAAAAPAAPSPRKAEADALKWAE